MNTIDISKNPPVTQEPILHVDCTPDSEYPLRILRAYLENTNVRWDLSGEFSKEVRVIYEGMNEASAKRARILDRAIRILEHAELNGRLDDDR